MFTIHLPFATRRLVAVAAVDEDLAETGAPHRDRRPRVGRVRRRPRAVQADRERRDGGEGADREKQSFHLCTFRVGELLSSFKDSAAARIFPRRRNEGCGPPVGSKVSTVEAGGAATFARARRRRAHRRLVDGIRRTKPNDLLALDETMRRLRPHAAREGVRDPRGPPPGPPPQAKGRGLLRPPPPAARGGGPAERPPPAAC